MTKKKKFLEKVEVSECYFDGSAILKIKSQNTIYSTECEIEKYPYYEDDECRENHIELLAGCVENKLIQCIKELE